MCISGSGYQEVHDTTHWVMRTRPVALRLLAAYLQCISVLQLCYALPEIALQGLRPPRELQLLLLSHSCQLLQSSLCMGLHAGNLCMEKEAA